MMKLAFVCFSFNKDEDLIWYTSKSIDFINKNNEYEIDFYLINDKNHPIKKFPENAIVMDSDVDRGFNISGLEFIKEEYKIFKKIADSNNYDFLIKFDSDTWIEDLNVLKSMDPNEICEAGQPYKQLFGYYGRTTGIAGYIYAITIPTVNYLYEQLQNKKILFKLQVTSKGIYPEDDVKSYLLKDYKHIAAKLNHRDGKFGTPYKAYLNPCAFKSKEDYRKEMDKYRVEALDKIKARYYKELAAK